jgi:anti-sigma regulatory factor (Ser/Thr protein kinase)
MRELSQCTIHVETRPHNLRLARKLVASAAQLAGADSRTASEIELAVGEALNNAHIHAYQRGVGPVQIDVLVDGPQFTMVIHDHGAPVAPPVIPKETPGEGSGGGRGLYLIGQLMDDATVERTPQENRGTAVRMMKKLF